MHYLQPDRNSDFTDNRGNEAEIMEKYTENGEVWQYDAVGREADYA